MKTKKDFEAAAAIVRALPKNRQQGQVLLFVQQFKQSNPKFDVERFCSACGVVSPKGYSDTYMTTFDCEVNLRHVEFTIYYRWNDCDVDAALVPHLSRVWCGEVTHEVGKADLCGGGYEVGRAEKTPIADTVYGLYDVARHTKWPKDVRFKGGYGKFIQGYSDMCFDYEGDLSHLQATVEQCKAIIIAMIQKHIRYHGKGDQIRNGLVNVFAGTGSDIRRVM